ncbi:MULTISPECIES: hypothetical protein [unclassified Streptomyces]|uniref:hypothetical protein n=1 Tax=unclassified Streptomyces TaxID=2593676 RepID=UPI00364C921E
MDLPRDIPAQRGPVPDDSGSARFAALPHERFRTATGPNPIEEVPGAAAFLRAQADSDTYEAAFATAALREVTTSKPAAFTVPGPVVTAAEHTFREHPVPAKRDAVVPSRSPASEPEPGSAARALRADRGRFAGQRSACSGVARAG